MRQVPKLLSPLVREWAPNAFTVSFKVSTCLLSSPSVCTSGCCLQLETNEKLLISKAKQAIERYQHQVCGMCVLVIFLCTYVVCACLCMHPCVVCVSCYVYMWVCMYVLQCYTLLLNIQVVIANQLDSRKRMVVVVSNSNEMPITMTDDEMSRGDEIERKIVDVIVKLHNTFIITNK